MSQAQRPTQIKGLSQERRLVKGGKLKIGEKRIAKSGNEYPAQLDHFRFDPLDESLQIDFANLYGPEPKSLPVLLPSDDRAQVFPQAYCAWKGGKLWCTGDNERGWRKDFETGLVAEVACNEDCPFRYQAGTTDKARTCKPEGLLRVILPDMPTLSVFEFRAGKMSLIRLNSCLDVIETACGRIGFIPLNLSIEPQQVVVGKSAMTVQVARLDVRCSFLELARHNPRSLALGPAAPALALDEAVEGHVVEELVGDVSEAADALYGPAETPAPAKPATPPPAQAAAAQGGPAGDLSPEDQEWIRLKEEAEGLIALPALAHRTAELNKSLGKMKTATELRGFVVYLKRAAGLPVEAVGK